jgi:hypothetical protein
MSSTIYRAAKGAHITDRDADILGRFIHRRFRNRPVTAEAFVDAARPDDSPAHDYFEWDNHKAAEEHRKTQARSHLRAIEIVIVEGDNEQTTRAFHHVQLTERDTAYVPQQIVWSTAEYREQVIARAHREAERWMERYEQYEELAGAVGALREALAA